MREQASHYAEQSDDDAVALHSVVSWNDSHRHLEERGTYAPVVREVDLLYNHLKRVCSA